MSAVFLVPLGLPCILLAVWIGVPAAPAVGLLAPAVHSAILHCLRRR